MSLLSLIAVFLIEQLQPLDYRRVVEAPLAAWGDLVEARCNAGEATHGAVAWGLAIFLPVALVWALYAFLHSLSPILAWLLNVGVLYLTMGFRQFSHHFTEIQEALRLDDLPRARQLLGEWQGRPADGLGAQEIARLSIEAALAASHRHVFAVLLWFILLPGPCGAVLYRMATVIGLRWAAKNTGEETDFSAFSRRVFGIIEWLPSRATASVFAIVGNFEDAVYCWRTQGAAWADSSLGIVLASGAGALGVQLGRPLAEDVEVAEHAELGLGDPPDVDFMQSGVGLVWRAAVLWLLLLFLLWLASLAG